MDIWIYYDGVDGKFYRLDHDCLGRMRSTACEEALCLVTYERIDVDDEQKSDRSKCNFFRLELIPRKSSHSTRSMFCERREEGVRKYKSNKCPDTIARLSNQPIPRKTTATFVRSVVHTDETPRAPSSRSPSEIRNYDRSRSSNNHLPTRDIGTIRTFFPGRRYGFITSHSDLRRIFFILVMSIFTAIRYCAKVIKSSMMLYLVRKREGYKE